MRASKKNSVQKIKVFLRFLKCDSATLGKPFVQNDMKVRWQNGIRTQFLKVFNYKRHDLNCICWIINTWINQKKMYPASSKTYTHSTSSLFDWYVWILYMISFSIPWTFTLRNIIPTLSFCAKPKAKSQNPSSNKLPSPSKRVGTVPDGGWGPDKNTFPQTLIRPRENVLQRKKVFLSLVNSTAKCNKGMIHEEYLNRYFHSPT